MMQLGFVNYLCSNQMDKPVGTVTYTCWLTQSGGIRRDLAVGPIGWRSILDVCW